jgi:hypothetical protein
VVYEQEGSKTARLLIRIIRNLSDFYASRHGSKPLKSAISCAYHMKGNKTATHQVSNVVDDGAGFEVFSPHLLAYFRNKNRSIYVHLFRFLETT